MPRGTRSATVVARAIRASFRFSDTTARALTESKPARSTSRPISAYTSLAAWIAGRIAADGPPEQVLADPAVIRSVIGE